MGAQACSIDDGDDRRARWREVQALEKVYLEAAPENRTAAKQAWADAVREFLTEWPEHRGAERTWTELQRDYAEQLEANGHFREASLHYRSLLERDPGNDRLVESLQRVERRLSLSRADFESLEKGMSRDEVVRWLGLPRPGWDRSKLEAGEWIESWYYRGADGVIRGVHFREGTVFAVDLD